jgi:NADPH:quinone reductase
VRAAIVESLGRPPAPAEVPEPRRRPGEALVRIRAAALNPVELHIWKGHFFDGPPRPPYVIGLEGVGVVEEGERLSPGTRVRVEYVHPGYGRDGALAEYAVVPEEPDASDRASQASVAPIGDQLDDTAAAALGVPVFTALMCLERAQRAGASLDGAHVLVTGATGAVGLVAVQLAKLMGAARVVAAGRNPERLERALTLGADATVELDSATGAEPASGAAATGADPAAEPASGAASTRADPAAEPASGAASLSARFAEAAEGRLDVALDPLWGEPARAAIDALTRGGVYVSFGQAASPVAELSGIPMRNRRVAVVGHSGAWATPQERQAALARAHALAGQGGRPLALDTEELALEQIGEGWERLSRSAGRRLVVKP